MSLAAASPLPRYLTTCPAPELSRVEALARQHGCDPLPGDINPLHLLLTASPAPCHTLPALAGALLEAGARLDQRDRGGNTPLLCLASLLERAEWGVASELAKLFCTRNDCDVNSGTALSIMSLL